MAGEHEMVGIERMILRDLLDDPDHEGIIGIGVEISNT